MLERYWLRVEKTNGCWLWRGSVNWQGYGSFYLNGKSRRATHVAVWLATGEWPQEGMLVCHRCDNPPCVNPDHLFVGTPRDNVRDALAKGRLKFPKIRSEDKSRGERHGSAKLTADQVLAIRAASGTQRALAAQYGVDHKTIFFIRSGRTWRHLLESGNG